MVEFMLNLQESNDRLCECDILRRFYLTNFISFYFDFVIFHSIFNDSTLFSHRGYEKEELDSKKNFSIELVYNFMNTRTLKYDR